MVGGGRDRVRSLGRTRRQSREFGVSGSARDLRRFAQRDHVFGGLGRDHFPEGGECRPLSGEGGLGGGDFGGAAVKASRGGGGGGGSSGGTSCGGGGNGSGTGGDCSGRRRSWGFGSWARFWGRADGDGVARR